jgi:hypothetical protein
MEYRVCSIEFIYRIFLHESCFVLPSCEIQFQSFFQCLFPFSFVELAFIYLFICGLFNEAVSSSDYEVLELACTSSNHHEYFCTSGIY